MAPVGLRAISSSFRSLATDESLTSPACSLRGASVLIPPAPCPRPFQRRGGAFVSAEPGRRGPPRRSSRSARPEDEDSDDSCADPRGTAPPPPRNVDGLTTPGRT